MLEVHSEDKGEVRSAGDAILGHMGVKEEDRLKPKIISNTIIRAIEAKVGRPIGILADLQGPKLRIGTFAQGPVILRQDQAFRLDLDPTPGDATRVHLPHPEIFAAAIKD